jgi:retron-type reverse transcriptase
LPAHIEAWAQRLKAHRDRAKLVRRCYLPTAHGPARPLGIPARAATRGQRACAPRRSARDEPDWRACRAGYRAGRGALEARRALPFDLQEGPEGDVVAGDVKGCVDPLDPTWWEDRLRVRSADRAWLKLLRQGLPAGILETDGPVIPPETGTPQGGTGSPVRANG